MRYYQDIKPGDTLRAGDEIYSGREWIPIAEESVGVVLSGRELLLFRRPVDAVPREEHERLQRAVEACSRYFEHCERVSVSQHRSDSGQMAARMALRNEAREAIQKLKEVQQ